MALSALTILLPGETYTSMCSKLLPSEEWTTALPRVVGGSAVNSSGVIALPPTGAMAVRRTVTGSGGVAVTVCGSGEEEGLTC